MIQYTEHSAAIAAPPQRRRRPALSCSQCRRRKIRCDQKRPSCNQCERSKDIVCIYKLDLDNSFQNIPKTQETSKNPSQLKVPNALEGILQIPTSNHSPSTRQGIQDASRAVSSEFSLVDRGARLPDKPVLDNLRSLNDKLPNEKLWPHMLYSSELERHVVPSTSIFGGSEHEKPSAFKMKLIGETHWMNIVSQFDKIFSYIMESERGRSPENPSEPRLLLHQCKKLGRAVKFQYPLQSHIAPDIRSTLPSREICDAMVNNYLRTFESIYRIIHIPSFISRYDEYWGNPATESSPFLMQLLVVLALGSTFQPNASEDSSLLSTSRQWVHIVHQWLSGPIEKSRMNITGIQIQCLLILARETLGIGSELLWISAGSLLRSAIQLGYHRDPKHFPGMSILQGEMRRRLWATMMELGLKESCSTAMPPLISMRDFDTEPPANINDTDITQEMKNIPTSQDLTTYTQTSLQIIMLQSFPVRLELAGIMTDFRTDLSYDQVLRLHSKITSAYREAQSLKIVSDNELLTVLQYNYLDFVLRRPLISLHRPWAAKARTDPRFYFSRKVCLDTCFAIVSYTNSADYLRLLTIGNGMWLEICSLPPIAISHELIMQLEEEALNPPLGTQARAKALREPLIQALRDTTLFKVERLKAGEKNVKGYLFSSMLLGQIEATENGEDIDKGIGDAAMKSLRESHAILKERATALLRTDTCETTPRWENQDYGNSVDWEIPNHSQFDASLDFDFDMLSSAVVGDWDDQSWL